MTPPAATARASSPASHRCSPWGSARWTLKSSLFNDARCFDYINPARELVENANGEMRPMVIGTGWARYTVDIKGGGTARHLRGERKVRSGLLAASERVPAQVQGTRLLQPARRALSLVLPGGAGEVVVASVGGLYHVPYVPAGRGGFDDTGKVSALLAEHHMVVCAAAGPAQTKGTDHAGAMERMQRDLDGKAAESEALAQALAQAEQHLRVAQGALGDEDSAVAEQLAARTELEGALGAKVLTVQGLERQLEEQMSKAEQLQRQIKILQMTVEETNAKAVALDDARQHSVQQLAATQKEAEDREAATAKLRQDLAAVRAASGFVGQTKTVQDDKMEPRARPAIMCGYDDDIVGGLHAFFPDVRKVFRTMDYVADETLIPGVTSKQLGTFSKAELKGMDELQEAARVSDIAARDALYMEMLHELPGVSYEQSAEPTTMVTPGPKSEAPKEERPPESPLKPLRLFSPSPARTPAERQKIEIEHKAEPRGATTTSWPAPAEHSPGEAVTVPSPTPPSPARPPSGRVGGAEPPMSIVEEAAATPVKMNQPRAPRRPKAEYVPSAHGATRTGSAQATRVAGSQRDGRQQRERVGLGLRHCRCSRGLRQRVV